MMATSLTPLLAVACPAGMAAMMGIPMLVRRARRRRQAAAQPAPTQRPGARAGAVSGS